MSNFIINPYVFGEREPTGTAYSYTCADSVFDDFSRYSMYGIKNETGSTIEIKEVDWYFRKGTGTPTGTATLKLMNDTSVVETGSSPSVSGVTATSGTGDKISFTFDDIVNWQNNYIVAVEYTAVPTGLKTMDDYTYTGGCTADTDFVAKYLDSGSWDTMTGTDSQTNASIPSY